MEATIVAARVRYRAADRTSTFVAMMLGLGEPSLIKMPVAIDLTAAGK